MIPFIVVGMLAIFTSFPFLERLSVLQSASTVGRMSSSLPASNAFSLFGPRTVVRRETLSQTKPSSRLPRKPQSQHRHGQRGVETCRGAHEAQGNLRAGQVFPAVGLEEGNVIHRHVVRGAAEQQQCPVPLARVKRGPERLPPLAAVLYR